MAPTTAEPIMAPTNDPSETCQAMSITVFFDPSDSQTSIYTMETKDVKSFSDLYVTSFTGLSKFRNPLPYALLGEFDFDSDGTIDANITFARDSQGRVTMTESPLTATTYSYDANGNLILVLEEDKSDGLIDYRTVLTYDTSGNLLTRSEDSRNDGDFENIETYAYDSGNKVIWKETERSIRTDVETYSYDASGRLIIREVDLSNDGTINFRSTFEYNFDGQLARILLDGELSDSAMSDGAIDRIVSLSYDSGGRLVQILIDLDANGTIDQIGYSVEYAVVPCPWSGALFYVTHWH